MLMEYKHLYRFYVVNHNHELESFMVSIFNSKISRKQLFIYTNTKIHQTTTTTTRFH